MANLPAETKGKSLSESEVKLRERLADLIHDGMTTAQIARAAYPKDKHGRRLMRRRLTYWLANDQDFQQRIADRARAELISGVGPAARALQGRAGRQGKPDAVKLLFEASGFHNPKVQHDHKHSGGVEIKLTMPRPERTKDEDIVDADVVDD